VVENISIWLDDHLWKRLGHTRILIATHRGHIVVDLQQHKLYWRYVNTGWALKTQPKIKLDCENRRLLVYFVFEKRIDKPNDNTARSVVSVDVNENNVTVKVSNKVFVLETGIKSITTETQDIPGWI